MAESSRKVGLPEGDPIDPGAEGVARLTVSVPRGLYRQFRLHALDKDITLSALLTQMIHRELS
ncbi:MAG: hypothetical protein ACK5FE_05600 [Cyanobacteriota bacterium]|jgi:hypothetical protein